VQKKSILYNNKHKTSSFVLIIPLPSDYAVTTQQILRMPRARGYWVTARAAYLAEA
jgi:hypothetical protein